MTKRELLQEYIALCDTMHMTVDGVCGNSTKDEIQNAINCLKCPDDLLADYLTVIRLKYPNTYRTIMNAGDYRRHRFNRLYVYNTARHTLA